MRQTSHPHFFLGTRECDPGLPSPPSKTPPLSLAFIFLAVSASDALVPRLTASVMGAGRLMAKAMLLMLLSLTVVSAISADQARNELHIAPSAQTGLLVDIGGLSPHSYRPNEFFANDWVYEGLVRSSGGEVRGGGVRARLFRLEGFLCAPPAVSRLSPQGAPPVHRPASLEAGARDIKMMVSTANYQLIFIEC